ncbi:Leukotriene A-4 hydrolase [Labeo rohita]|uniref:Leukotriene A-4 hydrolase n=1 Tax=Labeo rohita TaxID=84645 RepID=A0ABQ8MSG2_LABRO|nr:Leukotriene A-4 hydrolase [Labeo rohita]
MTPVSDPSSYSSLSKCTTKHLNLIYHVDFDRHVLKGKVALTVEVLEDKFSSLTLDSKDLTIFKVSANGQAAQFALGAKHKSKGSPLEITLPFEVSRTMVPCQDSPSVKHTYYAQVSVSKELVALMSALHDGQEPDPSDSSRIIYRFRQPEYVEKGAFEFSETETMLKTAESLAGPYVWGQYDVLVLPPSFPYGGMENPCLTFVTPTVLAGDRSLAGVIAHEISHSWTGNLVTNRTWEHFWLNEGHTVYLERMIARCMESEQLRQFKGIGGWKELQESVKQFGANNVLTNLVPNLHEVDTDEAFSLVPVTTEEWKKYLFTYFKDKVDILNKVDWNAWMHTPGMPPVKPQYDTTMADACTALCQRWVKAKEEDLATFTEADVKKFNSPQLIEFMALLLQEEPLPLSHVKKMQEVYQLSDVKNAEVRFRWLRICVKAHWEEAVPLALKMATEQGRMKFTRPLYKEVYDFSKYRDEAVKTFKEHRGELHPVTAMLVAKDLKIDG